MNIKNIDLGFGVEIEFRENEDSKIHNLKSHNQDIRNLGVRQL